ncbi:MAG TPA: hypothetical protein VGD74_00105 [Vulgatibacter sp.]
MSALLRTSLAVATLAVSTPAIAESGASSGLPEAQVAEPPAPSALPALPLLGEARPAAGEPIPLATDLPTEDVAPESTFVLRSEVALVDLRVRLLDENGKLVPTRDRAVAGNGTSYEVRPAEPLVTGTNYRLEIDGQRARHPTDVEGTTYAVQTFAFRTSGEKPAPPPPAAKKKIRPKKRR